MRFVNYQNDPSGVLGQQAQFANSAAPAAGVLSNSVPAYTTLGGKFLFNALAGAETDFVLFGYQVPAPPAASPLLAVGTRFQIQSVKISTVNIGAAVATTPTLLEWGLGINSTAASLATVDGGGTSGVFGPRRLALGSQSFLVGAAIGAQAPDLDKTFFSFPIVEAGRFFQVIVRVPVGTATASQQLRGSVLIDGYFGS